MESDELVNKLAERLRSQMKMEKNISLMSESEFTHLIEGTYGRKPVPIIADPTADAVLTQLQQNYINAATKADEHNLIILFTPFLVAMCSEAGLQFVNSEEAKWVHTLLEHHENYLKPDGCSSLLGLCTVESEHRSESHGLLRDRIKHDFPGTRFDFGGGIWAIKDFQVVVWEFKVHISPADKGTAYNYIAHLSRDDKTNKYCVILGDVTDFYIISGSDGETREIRYGKWTDMGSRKVILDALRYRNHGLRLLEVISDKLRVTVKSFLGAGAFGRCFMVEPSNDRNHAKRVLKIVLTLHDTSEFTERLVCGEFYKLCELRDMPSIINVDASSLCKYVDEDGTVIGVGYLMEAVGAPLTVDQAKQPRILTKLLKSLEALHTAGHYHGDSRVNNALLLGDKIVWVDLVSAGKAGADDNAHKRRDLSQMIGSVYGREKLLEPDFKEMLRRYPSEVVSVDPFVQYFTQG